MSNEILINKEVRKSCFSEIMLAFAHSFIEPVFTRDIRAKIKNILYNHLDLHDLATAHKMIQQIVFGGVCKMLDPAGNNSSVVTFACCGKTTCTQYANYYQKKGLKEGVVCADTFRDGAFDQLKQNSTKTNIPFNGRSETYLRVYYKVGDRLGRGVERFKEENYDLISVDTSGGHKQEEDALFEEMRQVSKPDIIILVIDGNIGYDAFDDDATKSPVIFIATGEHMDEFEAFEVKSFVSRLLGMGDWSEFMDKVYEVPELPQNLPERKIRRPSLAFFPPSLHNFFDSDQDHPRDFTLFISNFISVF
ncbi:signal recognition particle protein [Medicago truncatula]|uniref:Signal recognition particle protein n=1 Tax=Medicago truncatula TaxID=3880 RepID=A0A072U2Z6_MEDTR|nr:signal recognition particle protein [Medicago truncatula]